MRNDKHIAEKSRRMGKSYRKISQELGIPKSTLSNWFSGIKWSQRIKNDLTRKANYVAKKRLRLVNKARQKMWEQWRENFRKEAKREFPKLLNNPLFVLGTALYWGEGDHKLENGNVRLINTDPKIIRLFSKFLLDIARVQPEKLIASLILYPDLSEKTCKNFWSRVSNVPISQFQKTQFIQGRHPTKKTAYGMCTLQVYSRGLKEKILTWIDLLYRHH